LENVIYNEEYYNMALTVKNYTYAVFLSLDLGKSTGSGFRIEDDDKEFIVTAKHVLFDNKNQLRSNLLLITSQNYIGNGSHLRMIQVELDKADIKFSETEDIAIISLINKESYTVQEEGTDIISAKKTDLIKLAKVEIANDILLVGFPTSLIMPENVFFDINRPLLRKGIIAGINEESKTFIIDCPAYYGNSGGPILDFSDKENMKIIGLVSRYVPFVTEWKNNYERAFSREEFSNSGYAICTPLDYIFDIIDTFEE
jgi:S1-C subfamily serine protease